MTSAGASCSRCCSHIGGINENAHSRLFRSKRQTTQQFSDDSSREKTVLLNLDLTTLIASVCSPARQSSPLVVVHFDEPHWLICDLEPSTSLHIDQQLECHTRGSRTHPAAGARAPKHLPSCVTKTLSVSFQLYWPPHATTSCTFAACCRCCHRAPTRPTGCGLQAGTGGSEGTSTTVSHLPAPELARWWTKTGTKFARPSGGVSRDWVEELATNLWR